MVEGQHFIATRKLVDSDEEHALLEEEIERSKPSVSLRNSRGKLHYLLFTPFCYPPLLSGGRFHTFTEQSIFYGSEKMETALREVAYSRFVFLHHSAAKLQPMQVDYTHFVAKVRSSKAILLIEAPYKSKRKEISNPHSYRYSQPLGKKMREGGAELFTYFSARAADAVNVGLFTTEAFAQNTPVKNKEGHWSVYIAEKSVEFQRRHIIKNKGDSYIFKPKDFLLIPAN